MSKTKQGMQVRIVRQNIQKAETPVQLTQQQIYNAGDWITPPNNMEGFYHLVENSAILPQCIRAYKNNIAGFGIGIRYIEDKEETAEMAEEFEKATNIIQLLNVEQDTKEVFEDVIEAREIYGIAYIEVIRNIVGDVVQIEMIKDTPSIQKTKLLEPYISTTYYHNGEAIERKKKYCKYKQEIGGYTVYFKEFGDNRIMDRRDGRYISQNETLDIQYQANEIMEFAIGTQPYGQVRWIGQVLAVNVSKMIHLYLF